MKILQFSDLHLDARTCGVSRFDELSRALIAIQTIAINNKVDAVVFTGDACDPDTPELLRCVARLHEFNYVLTERGIVTHWLPGNHDVSEDGYGTSVLSSLEFNDRSFVHSKPTVTQYDQGSPRIGWLPYPSKATSCDLDKEVSGWAADTELVFGHLNLPHESRITSESADMARGKDVYWPLEALGRRLPGAALFGGHYHVGGARVISLSGGWSSQVHIVGSPASFAFGPEEKVEPSVFLIECDPRFVDAKRIYLKAHQSAKLKTISLGAPRSEWEDLSFVRLAVKPTDSQAQINKFRDHLMLTVAGVKLHIEANLAGPASVVEEATPMVTAEDGIAIAKQLAKDFATADTALKQEIEALTDLVAERACS